MSTCAGTWPPCTWQQILSQNQAWHRVHPWHGIHPALAACKCWHTPRWARPSRPGVSVRACGTNPSLLVAQRPSHPRQTPPGLGLDWAACWGGQGQLPELPPANCMTVAAPCRCSCTGRCDGFLVGCRRGTTCSPPSIPCPVVCRTGLDWGVKQRLLPCTALVPQRQLRSKGFATVIP